MPTHASGNRADHSAGKAAAVQDNMTGAGRVFQRLELNNIYLRAVIFGVLGVVLILEGASLANETTQSTLARVLSDLGMSVVIAVLGVTAALLLGGWEKIKNFIEGQAKDDQLASLRLI